jgi:hypothetical protein
VLKMSKENEELLRRLDTLIAVTAMNKQKMEKLLEGKNQTEQIQILKKWDLSNEIIALIIGTTPDVIAVRLSEIKSKVRRRKTRPEETGKESQ